MMHMRRLPKALGHDTMVYQVLDLFGGISHPVMLPPCLTG